MNSWPRFHSPTQVASLCRVAWPAPNKTGEQTMKERRLNPGAPNLARAWTTTWLVGGIFAMALWAIGSPAQVGGPDSGTWFIGEERNGFRTDIGPNGQFRHYVYPPSYRNQPGRYSSNYGTLPESPEMRRSMERGRDARLWLDAELERMIRED